MVPGMGTLTVVQVICELPGFTHSMCRTYYNLCQHRSIACASVCSFESSAMNSFRVWGLGNAHVGGPTFMSPQEEQQGLLKLGGASSGERLEIHNHTS